jgi:phospholipid/cholesterol/gamma-HCH transport system substrate-binding protein
MTMETNVSYTIVGAFVITLLAAMIFAIIWLSSGLSLHHYSTYLVYMQESVSGLSLDSPVEFNGVNVGTVTSIEINRKNPQLVELLLNINGDTPITRGTVATLNSRGFTGIAYLALKDKSTDLRPLVKEKGQRYPVIPSGPSLLMRLDTALTRLSTNIQHVSDAIQTLLNKENQQSIREILSNLSRVTETFANSSHKITTILDNTSKASAQLGPLLQSSRATMQVIEMQTLPISYQLLNNLNDVTRNLSQISVELKQNPSILIRGAAPQAPGPGEKR